jgi:hypothetical protein
MRAEGCGALEGRDARSLPAARAGRGREASTGRVRFLETTVRRLNERALSLLIRAVQSGEWTEALAWKDFLPLWASAEDALSRAAHCPMVLLDFNFQHFPWWNQVINTRPSEESQQPSLSAFHVQEVLPLARDLLLEAWSAARSTSIVSSLVFGMAPQISALIAQLSPRDMDRLVVHEFQAMRPRWEDRPLFWKKLLHAATQMDDQSLTNVHLHCLQLLGGELVSMAAKPLAPAPEVKGRVNEAVFKPRLLELR